MSADIGHKLAHVMELCLNARVNCLDDFPSGSFPNYDHNKYGDKPGQMWSADDQCRILLRDRHAYMHYTSVSSLEVAISFRDNTNQIKAGLIH